MKAQVANKTETKVEPYVLVERLGAPFTDAKLQQSILRFVVSQGISAKEFYKEFDRRVRENKRADEQFIEIDY